jgi:hypothetical protein
MRGFALGVVFVLLSGPAFARDDVPVFDPAAAPAALAQTFLKVDKPKALADVRRAAISNFRVEFAIESSAKGSSSSTMGATAVKSDVSLTGVTDEDRQAITDALYDDFVADLAAAGIEVLPYDVLKADKQYQSLGKRLLASPHPVGTQVGKSVFVGPHGAPVYTTNDDKHLSVGALMGGFGAQPQNIEPAIAKSLDAAVLRVLMAVQFAEQKASGGMFRNQSSVESQVLLAFVPKLTQVLVVTPKSGKARITLEKPVLIPDQVFTIRDAQSGGEKTAQAVGNAITGLMTGITRKVRKLDVIAEPASYTQGLQRYGAALDGAMAHTIRPASTPPS